MIRCGSHLRSQVEDIIEQYGIRKADHEISDLGKVIEVVFDYSSEEDLIAGILREEGVSHEIKF